MATTSQFAGYVVEQMSAAGAIESKKMFGEYGLYLHGKIFALVCDNQLYIKPTAAGESFLGQPEWGHPYPGSKPYLHVSELLDNREKLCQLVKITVDSLPEPKPKKPRKKA